MRDGIISVNPARVTGWQKLYKQAEDELRNPRALALPDWDSLVQLADALMAVSHDQYRGARPMVSSSPRAPPPGSAKSQAAASRTSTPTSGSGPCGARPHPHPAA
ncbi:hypothetical protein GCM10010236_44710 [Streptomyces eurythermus]|nr:hypothetical protein GCM10010236_44710 [Streptomyces eurythermus]